MRFRDADGIKDPEFKKGQLFSNADEFKEAVRAYGLKYGKELKFKKSEKHRVRVVCKGKDCSFFVFASAIQDDLTFEIKSLNLDHKCGRSFKTKIV